MLCGTQKSLLFTDLMKTTIMRDSDGNDDTVVDSVATKMIAIIEMMIILITAMLNSKIFKKNKYTFNKTLIRHLIRLL